MFSGFETFWNTGASDLEKISNMAEPGSKKLRQLGF